MLYCDVSKLRVQALLGDETTSIKKRVARSVRSINLQLMGDSHLRSQRIFIMEFII